jgi:hypothetical protein
LGAGTPTDDVIPTIETRSVLHIMITPSFYDDLSALKRGAFSCHHEVSAGTDPTQVKPDPAGS